MVRGVWLGEQVREDGQDPAVVVLARGETELVEDRAHVFLHGPLADGQPLADRVEALDGRLRVVSPPGAGTIVTAELPCES